MVLVPRNAETGRAIHPVGLGIDTQHRITSVEVIPELRPVKRIRATLSHNSYELTLMSVMTAFMSLSALDLSFVPLWAALPGVAVIFASTIASVVVIASHEDRRRK